jgi:hypothetical protein
MPADWDSSTSQGAVDTASISETRTATGDSDWDSYPDYASSEDGNTPEIAHLNQGNPDSPNGWGDYHPADYDQYDEDGWGDDYSETADSGDSDGPDPWGDTYPDAAYPADSSNDTRRDDGRQDSIREHKPTPDADIDADAEQRNQDQPVVEGADHVLPSEQQRITAPEAENADANQKIAELEAKNDEQAAQLDADQPDQAESAGVDTSDRLSPEQQQIHALETENADARQTIADLQEKNAAANQQIADLKADKDELTARLDLIERHPASYDGYQDRETRRPDHGADEPDGSREQDALLDERIATGQRADAKREEQTRWRRAASAENVGAVGTLLGAADLAMHGMPGLAVALGATAIGVVSWGQAKIEKRGKGKQ